MIRSRECQALRSRRQAPKTRFRSRSVADLRHMNHGTGDISHILSISRSLSHCTDATFDTTNTTTANMTDWTKKKYNEYYTSYMPWIEDKVLGYWGENKTSYTVKGISPLFLPQAPRYAFCLQLHKPLDSNMRFQIKCPQM